MTTDLRTRLLYSIQHIHERPIDHPQLGITGVLLREFTARERQYANEAVNADNPADPDQILYRAMLLQRCITDPDTGAPYADGRLDASTGQPAIDPRTRAPVFTVADVTELADGRSLLFNTLWEELLEVATMTGAAMFSRDHQTDRPKRNKRAGAEGTPEALDRAPDEGLSDDGGGVAYAGQPGTADGPGYDAAG